MKTVGVLALQGDFAAHCKAVERAGGHAIEVRTSGDLARCDGLIIPGGESTTILKLLEGDELKKCIKSYSSTNSIYGSCAGIILLAKEVSHPSQESLDVLDVGIERNAYGRQIDSSVAMIQPTEGPAMEAVFIRAPIIRRVGPQVRVLATHMGDPVWIEHGRHMATTFHPELTSDLRVHRHFLALLEQSGSSSKVRPGEADKLT